MGDVWTRFRARPSWQQAAAWVAAWPIALAVLVWNRGGAATRGKAAAVAIAVLGSTLYYGSLAGAVGTEPRAPVAAPAAPTDDPAPAAPEPAEPEPAPTPSTESPSAEPAPPPTSRIVVAAASVTRVIDGDTIEVALGARRERVRLIGVDTPESTTRVEPFGKEASAFTRGALPVGTTVYLEEDVEERDRYGRLLAYVWTARPTTGDALDVRANMFNARLLYLGWATTLTIPPNVAYADLFSEFQREARERDRGLWGAPPAPKRTSSSRSGNCDPSYPDVCIAPPPPDLDCGDIPHRRFRVLAPDPHNFDGDGDGIGCESG